MPRKKSTSAPDKKKKTGTAAKQKTKATEAKKKAAVAAPKRTVKKVEKAQVLPAKPRTPIIVGLGASAGGLEAFEQFFTNMPPDSGLAFAMVQHLDPTHKSILGDLVKRYTRMPVLQVEDGMEVEANHVYIIPPNRDMAVLNGKLNLIEPIAPRGMRQPIDYFFRSLAQDQRDRAICIILSGTGTDGTLGMKEVKGEGGMAMVQDPSSAKYDGMPRSAVRTGLADYVLPPNKMPEQLIEFVKHAVAPYKKTGAIIPQTSDLLQKIFIILRAQTGNDFSHYKNNTIVRRIERRMAVNQIERLTDYVKYLQHNPKEVNTLFKELLIGVTNFFRDKEAFECLEKKIVPAIVKSKQNEDFLRIWVPGCSTGEEAYSIGMLVKERLNKTKKDLKVQIFATDIDSESIEKARSGVFPESIAIDLTSERLRQFFNKGDNSFEVKKSIRDMMVFAVQNVIKDPPFSKLDLLSCRNLLIYMNAELQKKLLPLFHYSLGKDGYLFLGSSETLGSSADLFNPIDKKWKIFQRKELQSDYRPMLDLPIAPLRNGAADEYDEEAIHPAIKKISVRETTEKLLLEYFCPACVVINEQYDILFIHGHTGKYLEPSPGDASLNIIRMARQGLRLELTTAIRKVMQHPQEVRYNNLHSKINGDFQTFNLIVRPIEQPPSLQGLVMVVFEDIGKLELKKSEKPVEETKHATKRISELEHELSSTKEYLQTTIEELETANEELKSTNEELQSSNEELQSTNEELETSKEELQSVNEELVTVNTELESKIEELSRANNDLKNLLASTSIGTLFLDMDLTVKRFTPAVTKVVNLIESDIGRPISHIVTNLEHTGLVDDIKQVLDDLVPVEKEVQTKDGNWYSMRILPYRTVENFIDGAVVNFVDITVQKVAQEKISKSDERMQSIMRNAVEGIITANEQGIIEDFNPGAEQIFGYSAAEVIGQNIGMLMPEPHRGQHQGYINRYLETGEQHIIGIGRETTARRKDGSLFPIALAVSEVKFDDGRLFTGMVSDITERKRMETLQDKVSRVFEALSEWCYTLLVEKEEQQLLGNVCRIIVDKADYKIAWVGTVQPDAQGNIKPVAFEGAGQDFFEELNARWTDNKDEKNPAGLAIRTGKPQQMRHIETNPALARWRPQAKKYGYGSVIALPITDNGGGPNGVLCVYASEPDAFYQQEIELLEKLSKTLSKSISCCREGSN